MNKHRQVTVWLASGEEIQYKDRGAGDCVEWEVLASGALQVTRFDDQLRPTTSVWAEGTWLSALAERPA